MQATSQRLWVGSAAIGVLCFCLVALAGRLTYIQVKMRPSLLGWAQKRQSSVIELPGRRGRILDRRQRVLAGSHDQYTVFADPLLVSDHAKAAAEIAAIEGLGLRDKEILEKLEHNPESRYVVLKRGIDGETAKAVEKIEGLEGVGICNEPARVYTMGSLAAHVVGFVGLDDNGKVGRGLAGIEMTCQSFLRDHPGKRVVYWDARRRNPMFQDPDSYVEPKDGMDVVLTIDSAIQEIVERELAKTVEKFKPEVAMGLVMSPKTGEILAMAISPTFDPAHPGKSKPEAWRNRILTDPVEPGSIFKPFVLVGALQAGVTRPEEVFFCGNGIYQVGTHLLHDHSPYGNLSVELVVAHSSNIGMAKIGERMGSQLIHDTLCSLGLNRKTGIDLDGEDAGLLTPARKWEKYFKDYVPMGQVFAFTPIQLATAFCTFANGGRLVKPHVVAGIVDRAGNIVEDRRPKDEFKQVIDAKAAETLRQILVSVVNKGTGAPAQLEDWQVMGKTGTAQIHWAGHRGYEANAYLGSFIAAAPASDPQVVCLVMVRKPVRSIGYYGGTVAAPAVKNILQEVLPYLNVPHDKTRSGDEGTHLVNLHD